MISTKAGHPVHSYNLISDHYQNSSYSSQDRISKQAYISPPGYEPSPTAMQLSTQRVTEVYFQEEQSRLVFGNGADKIILDSTQSIHFQSKTAIHHMQLVVPGELMGLSQEDFKATFGQPLRLSFTFNMKNRQVEQSQSLEFTRPQRNAADILKDIADALAEVAKQPGNKNLALSLDIEAIQSLIGNRNAADLMDDIVALINLINSLRKQENTENYHVLVSGKGTPEIKYSEEKHISLEKVSIDFDLTIMPPENQPEDDQEMKKQL
jgi:hypothetical protein